MSHEYEQLSNAYHELFAELQAVRDENRLLRNQYNVDSNAANARWAAGEAQYHELMHTNERNEAAAQAAADALKNMQQTLVKVQENNAHLL